MSTGTSTWEEIQRSNFLVRETELTLLHCVSSYPCPPDILNMPKLLRLKEEFGEVGYSGHFQGIDDALVAICYGAKIIEKHFTIDNDLPGRDNKFAILPTDLKKISNFRSNFLNMMINQGLDLQKSEYDIYKNYRGRWSKNEK